MTEAEQPKAKAAKKQRKLDEADAQLLDITATSRYKALNPQLPAMAQPVPQRIAQPAVQAAEVIAIDTDEEQFVMSDGDAESPEELDEFFTAAKEHEQQEYEPCSMSMCP